MAHRKQFKVLLGQRREQVAALYLRGYRQRQIAEQLKTSQSTISKDLKALHQEWKESRLHSMDEAKAAELDRLAEVEREAWEAWEQSKKDAVVYRTKDGKDGTEKQTIRKGQVGDPRFLERVQQVINKRCELLGLDAPTKSENKHIHSGEIFLTKDQMLAEIRGRITALQTTPSEN